MAVDWLIVEEVGTMDKEATANHRLMMCSVSQSRTEVDQNIQGDYLKLP